MSSRLFSLHSLGLITRFSTRQLFIVLFLVSVLVFLFQIDQTTDFFLVLVQIFDVVLSLFREVVEDSQDKERAQFKNEGFESFNMYFSMGILRHSRLSWLEKSGWKAKTIKFCNMVYNRSFILIFHKTVLISGGSQRTNQNDFQNDNDEQYQEDYI